MKPWRYEADPAITNLAMLVKARMRPEAPFIGDGDGRSLG